MKLAPITTKSTYIEFYDMSLREKVKANLGEDRWNLQQMKNGNWSVRSTVNGKNYSRIIGSDAYGLLRNHHGLAAYRGSKEKESIKRSSGSPKAGRRSGRKRTKRAKTGGKSKQRETQHREKRHASTKGKKKRKKTNSKKKKSVKK